MKIDDSLGWIDFEIGDSDTRRIDLFKANDLFFEATKGVDESTSPQDIFHRMMTAGKYLGLEDLSILTLAKIKDAVFARTAELKNSVPVQPSAA